MGSRTGSARDARPTSSASPPGRPSYTDVDGLRTPWPAIAAVHRPSGADRVRGRRGDHGRERAGRDDARPRRADRERRPRVRARRTRRCVRERRSPASPTASGRGSSCLIAWKGVGSSELEAATGRLAVPLLAARRWRGDARGRRGFAPARSGGHAHDDRDRRSAVAARHHRLVRSERRGRGRRRPTRPTRPCRSSRRSPTISTTRTRRRSSGSSRPTNAIAGSSAATGTRARTPSTR